MNTLLSEQELVCPYCWARISALVDVSAGSQRYVEDCEVCCNPIEIHVAIIDGELAPVQGYTLDDTDIS